MNVFSHLSALGRGDRPGDEGLLGNTRCAWGGGELIGEEAILAGFCAIPFSAVNATVAVATPQSAALVTSDDALLADVFEGRIGRLWRVSGLLPEVDDKAVDVAFDADLHQERGSICFRAEDHPDLTGDAADRVLGAVRGHLEALRREGRLRARAFVVRAFGDRTGAAALLSIYSLTNDHTRRASFGYAIVGIGADGEVSMVGERARMREWTPRL